MVNQRRVSSAHSRRGARCRSEAAFDRCEDPMRDKLNVAIIGLGFGTQFIPIYKRHPNANMHAICRRSKSALDTVGDAFGVARRYARFEDALSDAEVDFVHINSPLTDHGWMS